MPLHFRSPAFAGFVLVLAAGVAPADPQSDKLKKTAAANLKQAGVEKAVVVETENLIVTSPLPEGKVRTAAAALQKTYKLAKKGLQFDPKDEPWKGKLTVYLLPDKKEYGQFLQTVANAKPDAPAHVDVKAAEPFVVGGAGLTAKANDADINAELSPLVARALLTAKAGTVAPPAWVANGFGRAAAIRAGGPTSTRFTTYKQQARTAVLGGPGKPPPTLDDVWAAERDDAGLLATALMDFMAFGPGAANFPAFVSAFRADEAGNEPALATVLEAAMWKKDALEMQWRVWVQRGLVVK